MKQSYRDFYGEYSHLIDDNEQSVMAELRRIVDSLTTDPEHAPAEHILSRVKSPESLIVKLRKDGLPETAEAAMENLSDIVGIRVVTHFVGDVYSIAEMIEKSSCWTVVNKKDYISLPKPNGYRSLHIIIKLNNSMFRTEIQLRTIAMDCWASLEHQLKYKKNIGGSVELIVSELKRCADEIASTDLTMQTIRDLIEKQG